MPLHRSEPAIMQPIGGLHESVGGMLIRVLFEKRRLSRLQADASQTRREKTYEKPSNLLGDRVVQAVSRRTVAYAVELVVPATPRKKTRGVAEL